MVETGVPWETGQGNPKLFSCYEMLEKFEEGTLGKVYKGQQKANGLIVTLKEMQILPCSNCEVEVLMVLVHPNVVLLIEYFMHSPHLFLVLKYLPMNLTLVIHESSEKAL